MLLLCVSYEKEIKRLVSESCRFTSGTALAILGETLLVLFCVLLYSDEAASCCTRTATESYDIVF